MSEKLIMAIDEGTTSARTVIIDEQGKIVAADQQAINISFPKEGWVEQDANEIWNTQKTTIQDVMNKTGLKGKDITAIGVTNQRETTIVWNKESGQPIYNAIVWQDRRTEDQIKAMDDAMKEKIREKTGLVPSAYFSATKIKWILDNVPNAKKLAQEGKLAFGTVNTWLIYRLTGEVLATDPANASRTMLFNINTKTWDKELLDYFEIPESMMPELKSNSEIYGKTYPGMITHNDKSQIVIASSIGDQQSALVGQLGFNQGDVKVTYGTGAFILMNIGEQPVISKNGLLTTIGYELNGKTFYSIEGSVMIAGAAIQWLRDNLGIVYSSNETEWYIDEANKSDDQARVYFVPSFSGLGSPYWDPNSRGAIFGLDRGVKREHIIKAAVESVAYQANDVLNVMKNEAGDIKEVLVDGGATKNDYLMQFQADLSQTDIVRPTNIETTALGAAYLAGLATGVWNSIDDLKHHKEIDKTFKPIKTKKDIEPLLHGWKVAVDRTRNWLVDLDEK